MDSDLVVQAPEVPDGAIAAIAEAARASSIEAVPRRPGATVVAWRLGGAQASPALLDACDATGVDHAFVPRDRRWKDLRVLAMDMDSTLITIECIDEIAAYAGRKAEVSAVTASAMRGELDFSESLRRRVALLAGLPVSALDEVYRERLAITPGAETLLAAARAAGARTLLVSGGFTFFTERLRERLGLDETASNTLEIVDGKLSGRVLGEIVDARGKAAALARLRASLPPGLAVAIGDGANDLAMMAEADVSVAFHAKPAVRAQATHAIDRGGLDAVLNLFN